MIVYFWGFFFKKLKCTRTASEFIYGTVEFFKTFKVFPIWSRSQKNTYRVYVGKYNLLEEEAGSKAMTPEKIIVHERWNPIFVALG